MEINWSDKDTVIKLVRSNGKKLKHASKELRNDPEVVLKALIRGRNALRYGSKELKSNKEFILQAIKHDSDGGSLKFASNELKNDYEVIQTAIMKSGGNILYASEELRNDKSLALLALRRGSEFFYLGDDLRGEIGNKNAIEYLKKYMEAKALAESLNQKLSFEPKPQRKLKL